MNTHRKRAARRARTRALDERVAHTRPRPGHSRRPVRHIRRPPGPVRFEPPRENVAGYCRAGAGAVALCETRYQNAPVLLHKIAHHVHSYSA